MGRYFLRNAGVRQSSHFKATCCQSPAKTSSRARARSPALCHSAKINTLRRVNWAVSSHTSGASHTRTHTHTHTHRHTHKEALVKCHGRAPGAGPGGRRVGGGPAPQIGHERAGSRVRDPTKARAGSRVQGCGPRSKGGREGGKKKKKWSPREAGWARYSQLLAPVRGEHDSGRRSLRAERARPRLNSRRPGSAAATPGPRYGSNQMLAARGSRNAPGCFRCPGSGTPPQRVRRGRQT